MELLAALGLGVALFASTDIDDLFMLVGFFADGRFRAANVAIGQFLGIAALIAISAVASLLALAFNPAYVGLLGLLPILMGIKRFIDLRRGADDDDDAAVPSRGGAVGQILSVLTVTIANGGDNVSAYAPLFATQSGWQTAAVSAAMLAMTGVWLLVAHWLVNHRTIGAPIRRYGERMVPFVLLALGCYILYRAGSLELIKWHPLAQ
jgi:cadmium resistance protein CadD (predicted permease)